MTPPPELVAAAQAAERKWRVPASITIAQWQVESAGGTHMPPGSNNPFGIKAAAGQPFVVARTREVIHGKTIYIDARFRKFASLAEAVDKHAELLATHPAYAKARCYEHEPDLYAAALTGTYATDPHYGALLCAVIHGSGLARFDLPGTPAPEAFVSVPL